MSKEAKPEKGTVKVVGLINAISLKKAQKWAKRWVKKQVHNRKLNVAEDDFYDFTKPCPSACDPNSPIQL